MTPGDLGGGASPSAGEALRETQTGGLPIGTVEQILEAAPKDLVEEVLPVPEWNLSVRVRSLTAAQQAVVKQKGLSFKEDGTNVAWAEMEIVQFQAAVVEPRFREEEVRKLHNLSGRGFQRIIGWVDEKSGTDKEALRKAREEFQEGSREDDRVGSSSPNGTEQD